jgi:hypothetical protein
MPSLLGWVLFAPSLALSGAAGYWLANLLHHPLIGMAGGVLAAISALMGWGCGKQRLEDGSLWAQEDYSPWTQFGVALVVLAAMTGCGWLGYGIGGFIGQAWNRQPLTGQAWGMVAGALGAWVYMMQDKILVGRPKALGTEYGIARFLEFYEALKAGTSLNPTSGLYLGQVRLWVQKKRKKFVQELFRFGYTSDISALVVSPAGGGKFSCSICPTLLTNQDDHIIVFDPTGQAAAVTGGSVAPGAKAWRRDGLKRRVVVINPFGILGHILQASASVNPLAEIEPDSPTFESDMRGIAAIIQPVHAAETNRFFSESSRELLAALSVALPSGIFGMSGGLQGVPLPVLLGFGAECQQPGCRVFDAMSPGQRDFAPDKIRARALRMTGSAKRGTVEASLIIRPFMGSRLGGRSRR